MSENLAHDGIDIRDPAEVRIEKNVKTWISFEGALSDKSGNVV
jgi:hypothetical protein